MDKYLLVGLGAFLGANMRYNLGGWAAQKWGTTFPVGTLLINLTGSFALGLFLAATTERFLIDPRWRLFLAIGFLGVLIGKLLKAVPVVASRESRRVIGIISDGDLIARGGAQQRISVAERLDAETLAAQLAEIRRAGKTARHVMTSPVITIRNDAPLAQAVSLTAERGLKRLPVVDAGENLVGILSRVDVLRTVAEATPSRREPKVPPGAARSVVVVDDLGRPIGIVDRQMLLHAVMGAEGAGT